MSGRAGGLGGRSARVAGAALAVLVLMASVAWAGSTAPAYDADFPDPYVLSAPDGRYYAYSTQVGSTNVPVMSSTDLVTWSPVVDALPTLPSWAKWGHTWAPSVAQIGDGWVMWYTVRHREWDIQCISVATATSPGGPFEDDSTGPFICQRDRSGSIDPSPFVDSDGRRYLNWKSDDNAHGGVTEIWGAELDASGMALVTAPVSLLQYGLTWEDPLIEGPSMARVDGTYHLFYGAGWWESDKGSIGWATCDAPLGTCTKRAVDAPWMASDATKSGPSGPTLFHDGAVWRIAYHAWEPNKVGYLKRGRRALWIDQVDFSTGTPLITDGVTASFAFACTDLTCDFTDGSDGSIASWEWAFGDGTTSTAQHPSHTYAGDGTYEVALTVTDSAGVTDTAVQSVTVSGAATEGIALDAVPYKVRGAKHVDLTWSGATSTSVDVHRDGVVVATTANDGTHTDGPFGSGGGSHTYQLCEAGTTTTCSAEVTVTF